MEPSPPTLDSWTSAFWTGRPLHLAELGLDLDWHNERRLGTLLSLTSACADTTVAIALAYLRGTEHWAALAPTLPKRLQHSSLGDQTRLIRDLNKRLPPSLQMALGQPAPALSEFARKMLPKNTPRSGSVSLQQGLEALVVWRNQQVHPSAQAERAQVSYDEAEAAIRALVKRTPALGLRLFYGTGFGTAQDGSPGMRMTLLSGQAPRPYRKGQPMALPSPQALHHVLAMDDKGWVLDLHPFLAFDRQRLHVFQYFRGGSDGRPGKAIVWHPKTQAIDEAAGAEVNALFREPLQTAGAPHGPSSAIDVCPRPATREPEVARVVATPVAASEAPARQAPPKRRSRSRRLGLGLGGALVILMVVVVVIHRSVPSDAGHEPPSASNPAPVFRTPPVPSRLPADLLSTVSDRAVHWGDSLGAVLREAGGELTATDRGACHDAAWRHVSLPSSTTRMRGGISAEAFVDSEAGLFELDVYLDPARQSLLLTKVGLERQLGSPRTFHSRRYPEPVYRWDRGDESLNTTLTTRADASLMQGHRATVVVRVFQASLQTRARAHLQAACPAE